MSPEGATEVESQMGFRGLVPDVNVYVPPFEGCANSS